METLLRAAAFGQPGVKAPLSLLLTRGKSNYWLFYWAPKCENLALAKFVLYNIQVQVGEEGNGEGVRAMAGAGFGPELSKKVWAGHGPRLFAPQERDLLPSAGRKLLFWMRLHEWMSGPFFGVIFYFCIYTSYTHTLHKLHNFLQIWTPTFRDR